MAAYSYLMALFLLTASADLPGCGQGHAPDARAGCPQLVSSDALQRLLPGMELRRIYEPYELCPGEELDPYAIWREVNGPPAAADFLRDQFTRIGSVGGLVEWMSCQGFYIRFFQGPFRNDERSAFFVQFGFPVYERDGKDLWRDGHTWWRRLLSWPPIHAHITRFFVDASGQMTRIATSDQIH